MTKPRRVSALALAVALAAHPAPARADVIGLQPGLPFAVGLPEATTAIGTAADETIFGDPIGLAATPASAPVLVSYGLDANASAIPADGGVAGGRGISPDGEWILLESGATNLIPGKVSNGLVQIYRRNVLTGETQLVSSTPGGAPASSDALGGVLSPDGRWVAFRTKAQNLLGSAVDDEHLVVKDLETGAVHWISRNRSTGAAANGLFVRPAFSPDGSRLAYVTNASDLIPGGPVNIATVIVVSMADPANAFATAGIASADAIGTVPSGMSTNPVFSPDGVSLAFETTAQLAGSQIDSGINFDVYVKVLGPQTAQHAFTGNVTLASADKDGAKGSLACQSDSPTFSPDGRHIAFSSDCEDLAPEEPFFSQKDIFLKTLVGSGKDFTGTVRLVSATQAGGQSTFHSTAPVFSPDGRGIAFLTKGTQLAGSASDAAAEQALFKDLTLDPGVGGQVFALSSVVAGTEMHNLAFSPDGRFAYFDNSAANLPGNDDMDASADIFRIDIPAGTGAADVISGEGGDDRIYGMAGLDNLNGNAGDDTILGGPGSDIIQGGDGADRIVGGADGDTLFGQAGNDVQNGGPGDDSFVGRTDTGDDRIDGGIGTDTVSYFAPRHRYRILPVGAGVFTIEDLAASGQVGDKVGQDVLVSIETLSFASENLQLAVHYTLDGAIAGSNNKAPVLTASVFRTKPGATVEFDPAKDPEGDPVTLTVKTKPKVGTASVKVVDGRDRIAYAVPAGAKALADSFEVTAKDPWGGVVTLKVNMAIGQTLRGTASANKLTGGAGDDRLLGLGGNDRLYGGSGNDRVEGGTGADRLYGGHGNDALLGGSGADQMTGGTGDDTYSVDRATDKVIEQPNQGFDTVRTGLAYTLPADVEALVLTGKKAVNGTGNGLANRLTGNPAANRLSGKAGNDTLQGGAGADRLDGGTGSDTASWADRTAAVTVDLATGKTGGAAKGDVLVSIENLVGSPHADALAGNAGANSIDGGKGGDLLTGGGGADVFLYPSVDRSTPAGEDLIQDLQSPGDVVDLSAIDANTKLAGDQDFDITFMLSGVPAQMTREEITTGTFRLLGDVDGDGKADFSLRYTVAGDPAKVVLKGVNP